MPARLRGCPFSRALADSQGGSRVRVEVKSAGLYGLQSDDIASALGLRPATVRNLIRSGRLALTNQGRRVATQASSDARTLYFFGEAIQTPYTTTNVYFLSRGRGVAVKTLRPAMAGPPGTTFTDTRHIETDVDPLPGQFHDPDADFWVWGWVMSAAAGYDSRTFTFHAPGVVSGKSLRVSLLGMGDTTPGNDHHVAIKLNGVPIGDTTISGLDARDATFALPGGVLVSGTNTVELDALTDTGDLYGLVGLQSFDLTYTRSAVAVDDQLLLTADSVGLQKVGGFSTSSIRIYDVTSPLTPRRVIAGIGGTSGAYWATFAESAGHRYLAAARSSALAPNALVEIPADGASTASAGADYVVICPPAFKTAAMSLADYRKSQGLSVAVFTTQQIYDDFAYGLASPVAMSDFLRKAHDMWNPAPRYVVLAGKGSYDYHNNTGKGDSLVPPLLTDTRYGLTASDTLLADSDGDRSPDVALGRISAHTSAELSSYVEKVKAYEASTGDWRKRVFFSADGPDDAGEFGADSDVVAALVPAGYTVQKAYIGPMTVAAAKTSLKAAFTGGSLLVNYLGHAGTDRLTADGLLGQSDVASLTGAGKEPVLAAMTCMVGDFGLPGVDVLAETLTMKSDGGAIAALAPSQLEENDESKALDAEFVAALFGPGSSTLGLAFQHALEGYAAAGGTYSTLSTYALLGDPALKVVQ